MAFGAYHPHVAGAGIIGVPMPAMLTGAKHRANGHMLPPFTLIQELPPENRTLSEQHRARSSNFDPSMVVVTGLATVAAGKWTKTI